MIDMHGIILADRSNPQMQELVAKRTTASLPFAGRYRIIDFALSALQNAGVRDVGVVMQRDYQSLLDHIGSGKEWDMSRKRGGLRLLPPFSRPDGHGGNISIIDALLSVESYIKGITQKYVVLGQGTLVANIDLVAALEHHIETGAEITAAVTTTVPVGSHKRFVTDREGMVTDMLFKRNGNGAGYASLEVYIMTTETLLSIMSRCNSAINPKFHRDGIGGILASGGRIATYLHTGYALTIKTVETYYNANMDMLEANARHDLFPTERPVYTKGRADVSTYYGEEATVKNCLVADGCFIEGHLEDCVVFSGVRVGRGAELKNCIIMQDSIIGMNTEIKNVVADKDTVISDMVMLAGSPRIPLVLPKGSKI